MSNSTPNPVGESCNDTDNYMDEWKEARDVLKTFDERLHDLRKYGFSFLTVLLTTEAFLISEIPDLAKFGAFAITLVLISTLHLIDKNYVSFQEAANTRALVLERMLNLELSEIITLRFRVDGISKHVIWIYWTIIAGVLALGCFVFENKPVFSPLLAVIAIIAAMYIWWQNRPDQFYHPYADDWMISPLQCTEKQPVTVMVTNLNEKEKISPKDLKYQGMAEAKDGLQKPIIFNIGDPILEIIDQETFIPKEITAKENIVIYDSYSMILTRKDFGKKGLYKIRPRGRFLPLSRTIMVS